MTPDGPRGTHFAKIPLLPCDQVIALNLQRRGADLTASYFIIISFCEHRLRSVASNWDTVYDSVLSFPISYLLEGVFLKVTDALRNDEPSDTVYPS